MGTHWEYQKMKCGSVLRPIASAAISRTMPVSMLHRIDCER
jgi:hypothetical protein